jgi:hypothetical protein
MNRLAKFSLLIVSSVLISGCEQKESDDLAKAQSCLDKVNQDSYTEAEACLQYVAKYNSQQANILKCSILMTSGGLIENKITTAFNGLKTSTATTKEAAFMNALALENAETTGFTKAVEANGYCVKTQVSGLIYVSSAVLMGTTLKKTLALVQGTVGSVTSIELLVANCSSAGADTACTSTETLTTLGTAVTTVSESYCTQDSADQSVCEKINKAKIAGGTNTSAVGNALYCYLNNKTYVQATGLCS